MLFSDRDVTYTAIPEALLGAEAVITPCAAKGSTDNQAIVTAAKDIILYVALDQRVNPVPAWLSTWKKTDMTIANSNNVVFDLYALDVNAGESVTVGGNGQSAGCVNYTLLATERSTASKPNYGDVNCNGEVTVSDVVLLNRFLSEDMGARVTAQGLLNADCLYDGAQTADDSIMILQYLAAMIPYDDLGPQG